MKLRFYPKKTIVLAQFNAKKEEAQGDLNVLHAKRSEREVAILYVSAQDKKVTQNAIDGAVSEIDMWQSRIDLLESHDPPEVMMEIEL